MKTVKAAWIRAGILMLAVIVAVGSIAVSAQAEVRLPKIFGDHMVVQRDQAIPVWGWADPGEKITVALGDTKAEATADAQGKWSVHLEKREATTDALSMTVTGKDQTVTLSDVLVGDVWLCSGQSNMEWELGRCKRPEDVQQANLPNIRMNKVRNEKSQNPRDDMNGSWTVCTPETAGSFIAVGFYFVFSQRSPRSQR